MADPILVPAACPGAAPTTPNGPRVANPAIPPTAMPTAPPIISPMPLPGGSGAYTFSVIVPSNLFH